MKYLKKIMTWLYSKIVGEPFIPEYETFSIGAKCEAMGARYWNSYLPEILVLHIKTKKGGWRDIKCER